MLWLKAFHLFFVVAWFAGIFYLPRLFVYHALAAEEACVAQLRVMERRLYGLMNVAGTLAVGFGLALLAAGWWAPARAGRPAPVGPLLPLDQRAAGPAAARRHRLGDRPALLTRAVRASPADTSGIGGRR